MTTLSINKNIIQEAVEDINFYNKNYRLKDYKPEAETQFGDICVNFLDKNPEIFKIYFKNFKYDIKNIEALFFCKVENYSISVKGVLKENDVKRTIKLDTIYFNKRYSLKDYFDEIFYLLTLKVMDDYFMEEAYS